MTDPNIVVNGGFDLEPTARRVDRWRRSAASRSDDPQRALASAHEVRCDRCGGPIDGCHREVVGEHPDLGPTQRVFCRACVVAVPDIGLVERSY